MIKMLILLILKLDDVDENNFDVHLHGASNN